MSNLIRNCGTDLKGLTLKKPFTKQDDTETLRIFGVRSMPNGSNDSGVCRQRLRLQDSRPLQRRTKQPGIFKGVFIFKCPINND